MKTKLFLISVCLTLSASFAGAVSLVLFESEDGSPTAISADGKVILFGGSSYGPSRWENGTFQSLGDSNWIQYYDMTPDGKVLVGASYSIPIRWENGIEENLALPAGNHPTAVARAVSADGVIIVGHMSPPSVGTSGSEAAVWGFGVLSGLGKLNELGESYATDVSADGTIIVGRSHAPDSKDYWVPFRWEGGEMTNLGHPQQLTRNTKAHAISGDGRLIVGATEISDTDERAFIWENGVYTLLEHPDPTYLQSGIQDLSADGSVLVGYTSPDADWTYGALWFYDNGYKAVEMDDFLDNNGVDRGGFTTFEVTTISADGKTIGGSGWNPDEGFSRSFIVRLGETPQWGGFDILPDGRNVDSGDFAGMMDVSNAPWVYIYSLGAYFYVDEASLSEGGGWLWRPAQE